MQSRKSFLGFGVAAALLMCATLALGQENDPEPVSLTCMTPNFTFEVSGVSNINCSAPSGNCGEQEVTVSSPTGQQAEHIFMTQVETTFAVIGASSGFQIRDIGFLHEKLVEVKSQTIPLVFKVRAGGSLTLGAGTIGAKNKNSTESCKILVMAQPTEALGEFSNAPTSRELTLGNGCVLTILEPIGGPVDVFTETPGCTLVNDGVELSEVMVSTEGGFQGTLLGTPNLEIFSTGGSTCYSQVIPTPNGRLYTVCK